MTQERPLALAEPGFDERKTTEAAAVLISECGGAMSYYRLLKLLYLADRRALELWERPITYDAHSSMPWGPVPSTTYDIIKGIATGRGAFWNKYIRRVSRYVVRLQTKVPTPLKLSRAEVDVLKKTARSHAAEDDRVLGRYTHGLPEYQDPSGSSIPIRRSRLLEVLGYSEQDIKRIAREMRAEAQLDSLLEP